MLAELDSYEDSEEVKTASARKAWREAIASEVDSKYQLKLNPEVSVDTDLPLAQSHKLNMVDSNEATVEGIVDAHNKIMEQVKNLPKVKEAMGRIGNMLKSGKIRVADLDNARKMRALAIDPDAAAYWKQYFDNGDKESKEFGVELTKEFQGKVASQSLEDQKLRLKRAFALALDMQEKSLISDGRSTLIKQAEDLSKLDDQGFENIKRVVERTNKLITKTASMPAIEVGVNSSDTIGDQKVSQNVNLTDALVNLWNK